MSEVKYFILKPNQVLRAYNIEKHGEVEFESLNFSYCNFEKDTKVAITNVYEDICLNISNNNITQCS